MGKFFRYVYRDKYLYMLAFPGLLFFLIFKYVPMWGVVISFMNYSPYLGLFRSEWVGFEHFIRLFSNDHFFRLLRNTLMINLLHLTFFFPMPILLSLLLNEVRKEVFKRFVQSIIYLPHFLSWVVIVGITFLFLSAEGFINHALQYLGFERFNFLTNASIFWGLLTAQNMWKEAGWGTIIFLAAIAGVNLNLYEAAKIDGANRFRQAWHITLPAIRHIILVLFILQLGSLMDVGFEQVFLMMNGAVNHVADVFDTYAYRTGVLNGQFSYSTAVGLFKSVIGFILVVLANHLAKRFGEEGVY